MTTATENTQGSQVTLTGERGETSISWNMTVDGTIGKYKTILSRNGKQYILDGSRLYAFGGTWSHHPRTVVRFASITSN